VPDRHLPKRVRIASSNLILWEREPMTRSSIFSFSFCCSLIIGAAWLRLRMPRQNPGHQRRGQQYLPESIIFKAEFQGQRKYHFRGTRIWREPISLRGRLEARLSRPVTPAADVKVDFGPGTMPPVGSLAPGATIWWRWQVSDEMAISSTVPPSPFYGWIVRIPGRLSRAGTSTALVLMAAPRSVSNCTCRR